MALFNKFEKQTKFLFRENKKNLVFVIKRLQKYPYNKKQNNAQKHINNE